MEIIQSRVSVYEIELDLNGWDRSTTNRVPGFSDSLFSTIPTLKEHNCMSGKPGGFSLEVGKGTNFAHVIEHVILELMHLADPDKQRYTGWTREANENQTYVIHYSAPDFLRGRLGAILGVDLVKKLVGSETVELSRYVDLLKEPLRYFAQDEPAAAALAELVEPISVIEELEETRVRPWPSAPAVSLSEQQVTDIRSTLSQVRKHLNFIVETWERAFVEYSGNFGKAIIDKIRLLNLDNFIDLVISGDFEGFYRGIRKGGRIVSSYRIPKNFIVHSIWLYKNKLLTFIIEEFGDDPTSLQQTIRAFDDFYQLILQNASSGYSEQAILVDPQQLAELKEFRELNKTAGYILVVDDDEMIRRACRDILEYQGYRVILAQNGTEALEVVSNKTDNISLVMLDVVLPDMTGREVLSKIWEFKPEMRILIMSAYPLEMDFEEIRREESFDYISKPFTAEALGDKLQTLISS